jgi:serine/threonine protein kinase
MSSSSKDPARISQPSASAQSAVRPAGERTTLPGAAKAPEAEATIKIDISSGEDHEIDSSDFERITLVDLPSIARYGRYELLGRLAYGGMAEIFLAREGHISAQRLLVIKRVLPHVAEDRHFVDMFVDEARLAMLLNHPNICHVYSFGEEDGTFYIAMEWVNGKPLSKIIRRAREQGGIPVPVALKIIAQVAEALDYAHRACDAAGEPLGIVHRDVSPQNIMVSYDGQVKLLDFGIAKATSHSTRTEAGVIKGKFAYMSPQQCVGELIDGRADVFALGVCLFEALTGKNPFRRKTEFETMTRIVGDPTPFAKEKRPEINDEIEQILQTALMKQPERRFQTGREMQDAIETALPKLGVVMNASRIGDYIGKLFAADVKDGPQLDMRMSQPPRPRISVVSDENEPSPPPRPKDPGSTELDAQPITGASVRGIPSAPPKKKSSALFLIIGGVVLLGLIGLVAVGGGLAYFLFMPSDAPGPLARVEAPRVPSPVVPAVPPVAEVAPPVDPQVPAAQHGSALLESIPAGANIRFGDRQNAGTTPLELAMLAPGQHEVELTLPGYEPWQGSVEIVPGGRATVSAALIPIRRDRPVAGPPGQLSLNTRPWSKVYLGGRLLGTTPISVELPSGQQRLRLVDRDGNEHRRVVRIPAGGRATESYDLSQ